MAAGDLVYWKSADDEVPAGTVGRVRCRFPDGDAEVTFPRSPGKGGDNSENNDDDDDGNKEGKEPLVFAFRPDRLVKLTVILWHRWN